MTNKLAAEHSYNERHPIPPGTRALIVGTAPPPRFCKDPWSCEYDLDFDFFYGSGTNWMWDILPRAFDKPDALPVTISPEECQIKAKEFLECHGLWMRDVLARIRRKSGKENSARDTDLEKPNELDFANFSTTFDCAPNLAVIATTSEVAFEWLMQALRFQGITSSDGKSELRAWKELSSSIPVPDSIDFWISKHSRPAATFELKGATRTINVYILPSPSSSRSNMDAKSKAKIYAHVLKLGRTHKS